MACRPGLPVSDRSFRPPPGYVPVRDSRRFFPKILYESFHQKRKDPNRDRNPSLR
ncbi:hypothetical protein [Azospirillum palustre]